MPTHYQPLSDPDPLSRSSTSTPVPSSHPHSHPRAHPSSLANANANANAYEQDPFRDPVYHPTQSTTNSNQNQIRSRIRNENENENEPLILQSNNPFLSSSHAHAHAHAQIPNINTTMSAGPARSQQARPVPPPVPGQGQGQGQGQNTGEVDGVARGTVGGGYGPYTYTTAPQDPRQPLLAQPLIPSNSHSSGGSSGYGPTAPSPLPQRYSSNGSDASYGSDALLKSSGAVAGGATAGAAAKRPPMKSSTTVLAFDDKGDLDDALHTMDPKGRDLNNHFDLFSWRGWTNAAAIFVLIAALLTLFMGYPIITAVRTNSLNAGANTPGFNLGGINSTGQVPQLGNFPSLVDPATPSSKMSRTGFDGNTWNLVFSDEFETDGRTFYPGDDPYWEGVNLHYWPTGDFEWYDPAAITTANGKLVITMEQMPIHNLNFRSGMLQSWNKMCFSGSMYIEVSVSLPGNNRIGGFWPGVWTMGNLGRPGYGASTEGTWPYSYDSCDIGTLKNQTYVNGTGPEAALTTGANQGSLSYLPGQRASACTCKGEDHPGPNVKKGRSAPEIDVLEAQINVADSIGVVSQSAQFAPYDDYYQFNNASTAVTQYNTAITGWNTYLGGYYQQAVSSLTNIPAANYAGTSGSFGVYGFEHYANPNDRENAYTTWVATGTETWTMHPAAVGANPRTEISARPLAEEPMSMIINFGMSNNFQTVDFEGLTFPNHMYVEYVRVYQRSDFGSMGCDPADHPTAEYIANHANAYNDANLTTWEQAGYTFPKNSLKDGCT